MDSGRSSRQGSCSSALSCTSQVGARNESDSTGTSSASWSTAMSQCSETRLGTSSLYGLQSEPGTAPCGPRWPVPRHDLGRPGRAEGVSTARPVPCAFPGGGGNLDLRRCCVCALGFRGTPCIVLRLRRTRRFCIRSGALSRSRFTACSSAGRSDRSFRPGSTQTD